MPCAMPDERLVIAIGRLERALARIESMPDAPLPAPAGIADADYAALEARHQRLREGAAAALAGLDRLIGTGTPDL